MAEEDDSPEACLPMMENLASDNAKVEDFLRGPNAFGVFMLRNGTIIRYLKKHVKQLFKLAMAESGDEANMNAYRILAAENNPLLQDIVNEKLLVKNYSSVFETKEPKVALIGRYTVIFTSVCSAEVNMSEDQCQLYRKLIERVECLPIYNLYENLFTNENGYGNTRLYMLKMHLEKILPELIQDVDTTKINFNDPNDPLTDKLCAWYDFIKWGCAHEWFSRHFNNKDSIYEVLSDERKVPVRVTNSRWGAIENYIDKSNPEVCVLFLFKARARIIEDHDNVQPYMISCVNVIRKLSVKFPDCLDEEFFKALQKIMLKFQNNTFFLISVVDLIEVAHKMQGIDVRIAETLMPGLAEVAWDSKLAIRSCVFKILELLVGHAMRSKQLAIRLPKCIDFDRFKNEYVIFNKVMTNFYGGLSPADAQYVRDHYAI